MRHTTQCVKIPAFGFADTKPHYELLDGLRGVAALLVVFHHIFEGYAFAGSVNGVGDGIIAHLNHGYLAVDFFFLLSGFVIGYAYDDRWQRGFTLSDFFRRRLIRLHPMVVLAQWWVLCVSSSKVARIGTAAASPCPWPCSPFWQPCS